MQALYSFTKFIIFTGKSLRNPMPTKDQIKQKEQEIIDLARKLCKEKISDEYADLAEKMIRKMGRKREVPFVLGSSEIWATAVIHELGSINFLFDKTFLPYISPADLSAYYGLNKNTVSSKALHIEKLLKLAAFDPEFSTEYMKKNNPFNKIMMDEDGFLFLNDEEFEDDDDKFDDLDPYLDKIAIFVRPKQPMINWLNKLSKDKSWTLDDFTEGTTYLVSDKDYNLFSQEEIDRFVQDNFIKIFEYEFYDVWTNDNDWPDPFSFSDFKQWFEYHVSSIIIDLEK
jgi:hypothetical protein